MDLEKENKLELKGGGVQGYLYNPILPPAYNVYPYQPLQNDIENINNHDDEVPLPVSNNKSVGCVVAIILFCFIIFVIVAFLNYQFSS